MSSVTAIFVARQLRLLSIRESRGEVPPHHQAGNQAIMVGSILAAFVYTPALLWLVWRVPWWLALIATPLALIIAPLGFLLSLPLVPLAQWFMPEVEGSRDDSTLSGPESPTLPEGE